MLSVGIEGQQPCGPLLDETDTRVSMAVHAALGLALVAAASAGAVLTGALGRRRLTVAGYLGAA